MTAMLTYYRLDFYVNHVTNQRHGPRYEITANSYFSENGIEYPLYMAHLIVPAAANLWQH